MTNTYLQGLGFLPLLPATLNRPGDFRQSWRYQAGHVGQDGTPLFIEHPLGISCCRLSTVAAPFAAADIVAEVGLHDRPALEAALAAFYTAHGGLGALAAPFTPFYFGPARRQL